MVYSIQGTYYILAALAISSTHAYTAMDSASPMDLTDNAMWYGSYTYTLTGDCYSSGTATTNSISNTYNQYYSFTLSVGSAAFPTATTSPISNYNYNGCSHMHLYNWMG
jgi:hypothetical protein